MSAIAKQITEYGKKNGIQGTNSIAAAATHIRLKSRP